MQFINLLYFIFFLYTIDTLELCNKNEKVELNGKILNTTEMCQANVELFTGCYFCKSFCCRPYPTPTCPTCPTCPTFPPSPTCPTFPPSPTCPTCPTCPTFPQSPTTTRPTTAQPTTVQQTTAPPTTVQATTARPTTAQPTTVQQTTAPPTTVQATTARPTTTRIPETNPCNGCQQENNKILDVVMVVNVHKLYNDYCNETKRNNSFYPISISRDYVHFVGEKEVGSAIDAFNFRLKVGDSVRWFGISESKNAVSSVLITQVKQYESLTSKSVYIKIERVSAFENENVIPVKFVKQKYWFFTINSLAKGVERLAIDFMVYVKRDVEEIPFGIFRVENIKLTIV